MSTRIKRILLAVLTIGIIISIGGCASLPRKADAVDSNDISDCIVNGKEIYFIDDETKKSGQSLSQSFWQTFS